MEFMRIGTRIARNYFLVVTASVLVSILIFWQWMRYSTQEQVSEASVQTLAAVQINYDLTLGNASNYSRMIFSDANLQSLLRQGSIYSNLQKQAQVSGYLYNLIQAVPVVDSVFIFDAGGNIYSVGKQQPPAFLMEGIEEAAWYEEVVEKKGSNIFRLNAGGVLEHKPEDENYVSLIRQIRDLDNTAPLGILILNIPESAIATTFEDAIDNPRTSVRILDAESRLITGKTDGSLPDAEFERLLPELERHHAGGERSGYFSWRDNTTEYLVSYLVEGRYGCQFVSLTPYSSTFGSITPTLIIVLLVLVLNGVLVFIAAIVISRSVTGPVRQLLGAMEHSGEGRFETIQSQSNTVEFQQLYDGYNELIGRMQKLVQDVVDEQTAYRKAELHALQVQIKPHFLYNTLDSILSLNLSGQTREACRLLEALGSYYRTSVSKGGEVITVEREVEMVKNYMIIQNIRYQDLVRMEYDIDPGTLGLPMLKMVLQPLVENALYHGIRPKGGPGTIRVTARCEAVRTMLSVQDDGVGMSPEYLDSLLHPPRAGEENSFGLWGTLERVRIFYGGSECYHIESTPGKGTTITLFLSRER